MIEFENIKEEALNIFYLSIKNDLDKWIMIYEDEQYQSPIYNNYIFYINTHDCTISVCNINKYGGKDNQTIFFKYKRKISIKNFKIRKKIKVLENHFIEIEKNKKLKKEMKFIKNGITEIKKEFPNEIRKQKLNNLK